MKTKLLLLALLGISACVTVAPPPPTQLSIDGDRASVEVPFTLIDNRNFVDVTLNGRGPFKFILDTGGGSGVVVTPDVARKIGLIGVGSKDVSGAGAGKEAASLARLDQVQLGAIHLTNVPATILGLGKIQNAMGFERLDGIIGQEIFTRFVTTIDFERSRIRLTRPEVYRQADAAISMQLVIEGGEPFVEGHFDGVGGRFFVDTGDRSSISFCGPFAEEFHLLDLLQPKIEAMTGYGVGGPIPARVTWLRDFELGALTLPPVVARFPALKTGAFATPKLAGVIGNGVLKRFTVTFNYFRGEMLLEPNSSFAQADAFDRSGLWLGKNQAQRTFEILDVIKGSPAAGSGLMPGDQVLAINGQSVEKLKIDQVRAFLKQAGAIRVALKVRRKNVERQVALDLRDVL